MEEIHLPADFHCTERITNLKEHFETFAKKYYPVLEDTSLHESVISLYGEDISAEEFADLERKCSIENLTVPGEIESVDPYKNKSHTAMQINQFDTNIQDYKGTLKTLRAEIDYQYRLEDRDADNIPVKLKCSNKKDLTQGDDVVVTVRIFHPFATETTSYKLNLVCSHEILILGSQSLASLRDKIMCSSSNVTEVKDVGEPLPKKEESAGALMIVDNILYVDMRDPDAVDYSDVVRKFGNQVLSFNFSKKNMNEVEIVELNFRIGYPYMYQHNGDCEHILVFSDVKLLTKSFSLCRNDYPQYSSINRIGTQHCNICKTSTAKWMVRDSDRIPRNIAFFCQNCLVSYNYVDGNKIGTFKIYPYTPKQNIG